MIDRRRFMPLVAAAALLPLTSLQAAAQASFQAFHPLLVDLPGWKGNKPDGMAMEVPGSRVISSTREYQRGEARLNAQILVGPMAQGALAAANPTVKIETSEGRMSTSTVDGMQVTRTFTIADKSGAVIVALRENAVFMLSFEGIVDDEALTLAQRFNWKSIQAALPK